MDIHRESTGEVIDTSDVVFSNALSAIHVFKVGNKVLKVPDDNSTYQLMCESLERNNAEFSGEEFFRSILLTLKRVGVPLPTPWGVETLLVDGESRVCFWQKYLSVLTSRGDSFGPELPLRASRSDCPMLYRGPEFALIDDKKIFFDWDLYFLYLHDKKLRDIADFTRVRLDEVCSAIVSEGL